jgi:hypothetical protein
MLCLIYDHLIFEYANWTCSAIVPPFPLSGLTSEIITFSSSILRLAVAVGTHEFEHGLGNRFASRACLK